ncbi:ATP-dependent DNA helicase RecG [Aureimonas fodinaquatilis]|uniref:ATP-dependent DNA helicase RecG n=1 Tax=Aureimonas fodinaquatilis TaxID=2565783 RepID=A0A5B0DUJ5_9HYPH|nr:ATP-dependent DNA helicase RecG [Aureimonas fodinaquatilis]
MRPSVLDTLFASITSLPGVGPKVAATISGLVCPPGVEEARVRDLLFHLPSSTIDRRKRVTIADAPEGEIVTLQVHIDRAQFPPKGTSQPARIYAYDASGDIALTYFRPQQSWLEKQLPPGEEMLVSGKVEHFNGRAQMVHPDFVAPVAEAEHLPLVEPVYPMTAGLSAKTLRKAITEALSRLPQFEEWIEPSITKRQGFPDFSEALLQLHNPETPLDADPACPAFRRLAYDEFLASQVTLALYRQQAKKLKGRVLGGNGELRARMLASLPFQLTDAQQHVLREILADMALPERMIRLLQGDVGAGKTVVALMAMAAAAESGAQSALLVPTEILARQHFASLEPLCLAVGLSITLLTGRDTGQERAAKLKAIASGQTQIIVGTHALFQESVDYHNLGLAVVDEQHRFGVHQRLELTRKGQAPDLLVMTATPIPRTLVLTAFGDMDVSRLGGKPAGRQPITTVAVPMDRIGEIVDRAGRAIAEGEKLYWVCPLVEESEKSDLTAAQERYETLKQFFGDQVGLVHGQMAAEEKDAAMAAFKSGQTRIIVATTVVEVGVDVPDASIIVIEHAERFGLSQLHQLRGRVGRGSKQSSCVLLYKTPLTANARARLAIMRETEDGFRLAEEDLRLRGEGDLLGTRQSGVQSFRIARLDVHADLMEAARDDARLLLTRDAELQSERGQAVRTLLYLFGKDDAIRLIRAG